MSYRPTLGSKHHHQPVPRSIKRGSIHPLPHTFSWRNSWLIKHRDKFTPSARQRWIWKNGASNKGLRPTGLLQITSQPISRQLARQCRGHSWAHDCYLKYSGLSATIIMVLPSALWREDGESLVLTLTTPWNNSQKRIDKITQTQKKKKQSW
jgi:hypothetical protein